jgi:hypothetical protein
MPSVNIYSSDSDLGKRVLGIATDLRKFIAEQLSCNDRVLQSSEVSLRLHQCGDAGMISPLEIEIFAFHYAARVQKQDEICREIAAFIREAGPGLPLPHVWLILCELGHSWEAPV